MELYKYMRIVHVVCNMKCIRDIKCNVKCNVNFALVQVKHGNDGLITHIELCISLVIQIQVPSLLHIEKSGISFLDVLLTPRC